MESGSLYDLMNIKLSKLECDEEFKDLKNFVTNDRRCIQFIKALTDGFEVDEADVKIFESAQARARHSVVTFLMGLVFSNFAGIYDSISSIVNEDNNLELWLLTSLNHDQGYYSKYLKNEKIDYKKTFKYYLFDDLYFDSRLVCLNHFQDLYPNVFSYSYNEILSYDSYARYYHQRDINEKIDHGILGGLITYNRLISKHMKRGFSDRKLKYIKAASLSIAQHNIFKSPSKEKDNDYPQELIPKLGSESDYKIIIDKPLLLLLSLVDTVECIKKFGKENSVNGHYLETLTILKNIYVNVSHNEIEIDYSHFHSLVIKKGYFEEYVGNYLNGVYCLKKWTDLKIEKYGSKIRISI